jgi:hypothetical protein
MIHKRGCPCYACEFSVATAKIAQDKLDAGFNPDTVRLAGFAPRVKVLPPKKRPVKRGPRKVRASKRPILFHEIRLEGGKMGMWCDAYHIPGGAR